MVSDFNPFEMSMDDEIGAEQAKGLFPFDVDVAAAAAHMTFRQLRECIHSAFWDVPDYLRREQILFQGIRDTIKDE